MNRLIVPGLLLIACLCIASLEAKPVILPRLGRFQRKQADGLDKGDFGVSKIKQEATLVLDGSDDDEDEDDPEAENTAKSQQEQEMRKHFADWDTDEIDAFAIIKDQGQKDINALKSRTTFPMINTRINMQNLAEFKEKWNKAKPLLRVKFAVGDRCKACSGLKPDFDAFLQTIASTPGIALFYVDVSESFEAGLQIEVEEKLPYIAVVKPNQTIPNVYQGSPRMETLSAWFDKAAGIHSFVSPALKSASATAMRSSQLRMTLAELALKKEQSWLLVAFLTTSIGTETSAVVRERVEEAARIFYRDPLHAIILHYPASLDIFSETHQIGVPSTVLFKAGNSTFDFEILNMPQASLHSFEAFIASINADMGTHKTADGGIDPTFGRLWEMEELASHYLSGDVADAKWAKDFLWRASKKRKYAVESFSEDELKSKAYYIKIMTKIHKKGFLWLDREKARLQKCADTTYYLEREECLLRMNILNMFFGTAPPIQTEYSE